MADFMLKVEHRMPPVTESWVADFMLKVEQAFQEHVSGYAPVSESAFMADVEKAFREEAAGNQRLVFYVERYAAQLEDRAERANVHTAGLLIEIARELRKIAGAE